MAGRLRTGPRPWSITVFAVIVWTVAVWNLGVGFPDALAHSGSSERVAAVSGESAQFLIRVIPTIAIWLYASRIAKWLLTLFSLVGAVLLLLPFLLQCVPDLASVTSKGFFWTCSPEAETVALFITGLAVHALVLLLFTPSARQWFAPQDKDHGRVFD